MTTTAVGTEIFAKRQDHWRVFVLVSNFPTEIRGEPAATLRNLWPWPATRGTVDF